MMIYMLKEFDIYGIDCENKSQASKIMRERGGRLLRNTNTQKHSSNLD